MASDPSVIANNHEESLSDALARLNLELALAAEKEKLIKAEVQISKEKNRITEAEIEALNATARMYEMEAELCRVRTAAITAGFVQNAAGEWVLRAPQEAIQQNIHNPALEPAETTVAAEDDDGYGSERSSSSLGRSNSR